MRVVAAAIKRRDGWVTVPSVRAIAGAGLDGDVHASTASPRQVLICDASRPGARGANLVVDGAIDLLPSGTLLRIGDARLWLTIACETCHLAPRAIPGQRGMLARVLEGGEIVVGAEVHVDGARAPLPPRWQDRVADLLRLLPADRAMTYRRLVELAGVQATYCRALPKVLRALGETRVQKGAAEGVWDGAEYFA